MALEDVIRIAVGILPLFGLAFAENKKAYSLAVTMGGLLLWAAGGVIDNAMIADLGALLFTAGIAIGILLLAMATKAGEMVGEIVQSATGGGSRGGGLGSRIRRWFRGANYDDIASDFQPVADAIQQLLDNVRHGIPLTNPANSLFNSMTRLEAGLKTFTTFDTAEGTLIFRILDKMANIIDVIKSKPGLSVSEATLLNSAHASAVSAKNWVGPKIR